ncbi:hypothetical protein BT69DRAFT_1317790 [Atractiella rhizophila]|nr:hypothetical protein BT69DRAFT_1317790 [Atractiella rhizophila]
MTSTDAAIVRNTINPSSQNNIAHVVTKPTTLASSSTDSQIVLSQEHEEQDTSARGDERAMGSDKEEESAPEFRGNIRQWTAWLASTSPTAAETLDSLPSELLRLILVFASSSVPLSSLSAWSLVNRRWNDILQSMIFASVELRSGETEKFCQLMDDKEERKVWVTKLTLHILSSEELHQVKILLDGLSNLRRLILVMCEWDKFRLPPLRHLTHLALICVPPSLDDDAAEQYHPPKLNDLLSNFGSYESLTRLTLQGISNPLGRNGQDRENTFAILQSLDLCLSLPLAEHHFHDIYTQTALLCLPPSSTYGGSYSFSLFCAIGTLRHLDVDENIFVDISDCKTMISVISPTLQSLRLSLDQTTGLPLIPELRKLNSSYYRPSLRRTARRNLLEIFPSLYAFRNLKTLRLRGCALEGPSASDRAPNFALRHLVLLDYNVDSITFERLVKPSIKSLAVLGVGSWKRSFDSETVDMSKLTVLNFILTADKFPRALKNFENLQYLAFRIEARKSEWYHRIPTLPYCRYIWIWGRPWQDIKDNLPLINPISLPSLRGIICDCPWETAILKWGGEREVLIADQTSETAKNWNRDVGYHEAFTDEEE